MLEICPICNSKNVVISGKGFSKKNKAGFNYWKSISALNEIKNYDLAKNIPLYFCLNCESGWRGNTLLSKKIDRIYHTQHSLHWKSFEIFCEFIKGNNNGQHLESTSKLIIYLSEFLKKKINLIEIGSPLLGFGFQNANLNNLKKISSITRKVNILESIFLIPERISYFLIKIYRFTSLLKNKLKSILKNNSQLKSKSFQIKSINKNLKDISFYDIPTSIGWGVSSNILGQSTLKWLLLLNPNIKLINKYSSIGCFSDLTICFNYLDHFDNPVEIIKDIILISDFFIFNIHKNKDAAIQHKYTFSNTLDKAITNSLQKEFICINLSHEIIMLDDQNKFNYFCVGKKSLVNNFVFFLKNQKK